MYCGLSDMVCGYAPADAHPPPTSPRRIAAAHPAEISRLAFAALQDLQRLCRDGLCGRPPNEALTANLHGPDYVRLLCGTLDGLPRAVAELVRSSLATARPALDRYARNPTQRRRVSHRSKESGNRTTPSHPTSISLFLTLLQSLLTTKSLLRQAKPSKGVRESGDLETNHREPAGSIPVVRQMCSPLAKKDCGIACGNGCCDVHNGWQAP